MLVALKALILLALRSVLSQKEENCPAQFTNLVGPAVDLPVCENSVLACMFAVMSVVQNCPTDWGCFESLSTSRAKKQTPMKQCPMG